MAARRLRNHLGFSLTIVLTLALGVGANVGIFTIVNGVLMRPLPFPNQANLVVVRETVGKEGIGAVSTYDYADWKAQSDVFQDLAGYQVSPVNFVVGSSPSVRVTAEVATENYFSVLGATPLLGRTFTPAEVKTPGDSPVAVISCVLWQQDFNGSASVLGRTVRMNDASFSVIGVMRPGFQGFNGASQVWVPLTMRDALWPAAARFDFLHQRGIHWQRVLGRLKDGVTMEQAQREMQTIGSRLAAQYPAENKDRNVKVYRAADVLTAGTKLPLFLLLGTVVVILLIACMNIANMLLARAQSARRETAVRIALGASTREVASHFFMETVILCAAGTLLGSAAAVTGLKHIVPVLPLQLPKFAMVQVDWHVMLFAAGLAVFTALALTIGPALSASRLDLNEALQEGGRSSATKGSRRAGAVLVVAEIALAMMLLSASGLLLRSLARLHATGLGFTPDHLVTMRIEVPSTRYGAEKSRRVAQQLVEKFKTYPGVEDAGANMADLLLWPGINRGFAIEGKPLLSTDEADATYYQEISPGYFHAIGARIVAGRDFTAADNDHAPTVLVVSKSFADRSWPGEDAIGKRVKFGGADSKQPYMQVIGVASDYKYSSVRENPESAPVFYGALMQSELVDELSIVVRTRTDAAAMIEPLRRELQRYDPALPVVSLDTVEQRVADSTSAERAYSETLGAFAVLALMLAAIGIYGVISYGVTMRTGEIGVRMALGAPRGVVARMLLSESAKLAAIGLAVGFIGVLLAGGVLKSLLYQTEIYDPVSVVAAAVILAGFAMVGSLVPALRAMRIDPLRVLRNL